MISINKMTRNFFCLRIVNLKLLETFFLKLIQKSFFLQKEVFYFFHCLR